MFTLYKSPFLPDVLSTDCLKSTRPLLRQPLKEPRVLGAIETLRLQEGEDQRVLNRWNWIVGFTTIEGTSLQVHLDEVGFWRTMGMTVLYDQLSLGFSRLTSTLSSSVISTSVARL